MYVCPMHPEITLEKPGRCPICGMDLVKKDTQGPTLDTATSNKPPTSYWPLILIIGLISLATIALALSNVFNNTFVLGDSFRHFMAGFFLVFSGFKLLDLKGFAQGYFTYDLFARRWFGYGYVYPFLELMLALLFLTGWLTGFANIATIILMTFSGLGVAQKLLKHERFQCACLGTLLKVPLTKVTLIEDFGMAAMAVAMLWLK